ncbi:MAG: ABC transporter ATP-binding protein [Armatimonadota bacterium]|nr:ABC transporter ATP-binding protein [Armatimonadota bacterium]MDR7440211.1 ABC transporter ATP-binding protein [Armatimonadota bacterium]MDR7563908.1 ABC transporter ATP-binding protein [Armatimonadota bacterium]MDR7567660.1 ABC transporter ATP-binding protein [Armatimonadota bacterium]MDR7600930.1 ABC transporter ATP-binding protein [Armatimonadota bacterium]
MTEEPVLCTEDLWKRFGGVAAVAGVNLSVRRGTVHAIIGPNGAGKTTLFHLLTGFLRPDRGRIQIRGEDVTGLPPYRVVHRRVARTFQITSVFPTATALENVQLARAAMGGYLWRPLTPFRRVEVEEAWEILRQVRLEEQAHRRAGELPHGDRKKLELALALACDPEILLLDEPTSGIPVPERPQLMALVRKVVEARGITTLLIEHDMDVVFSVADRITVLNRGTVIAEGTPGEVRADPEVRRVYLGEETRGSGKPGGR